MPRKTETRGTRNRAEAYDEKLDRREVRTESIAEALQLHSSDANRTVDRLITAATTTVRATHFARENDGPKPRRRDVVPLTRARRNFAEVKLLGVSRKSEARRKRNPAPGDRGDIIARDRERDRRRRRWPVVFLCAAVSRRHVCTSKFELRRLGHVDARRRPVDVAGALLNGRWGILW